MPRDHAAWDNGAELVLRLRRDGASETGKLDVSLGGHSLGSIDVDGSFREQRLTVPAELLAPAGVRLELEWKGPPPYVTLDHALMVPRSQKLAAAAPSALETDPAHDTQVVP